MKLGIRKLATKLRLALVGIALFSIVAFTLAPLPILLRSIRQDRTKLFVEQFTRALAVTVSHYLEHCNQHVRQLASRLSLGREVQAEEVALLNQAVREPVAGLSPDGIFDLLVVVRSDGLILYANSFDRFGAPLETASLKGRRISDFAEEEQIFRNAASGKAKHDWYRSKLVAQLRGERPSDLSRQYAIALAEPIPNRDRVLVAVLNWEAIQKILDQVEGPLAQLGFPFGYAFMLARDDQTIIAHKFRDPAKRNNYGTRLLADHNLPELFQAVRQNRSSWRYQYPPGTWKISGLARIDDADFAWTVGLGINDADVIAPIHALTRRLSILGGVVTLLGLALSQYLSQRITLDLRRLRHTALRIAEGLFSERVEVRSGDEVGQVGRAFNIMTEALAERDEVIRQQQQGLFERKWLEHEVRIASEVQERLFPQVRVPLNTLDYVGYCQPARGVGGDYYDFLTPAPGKLGLLVADVSGKGLSAALLMASLHACVRTHAPLLGDRCGEVVTTVNGLLHEATEPDTFATMFYAVYDDVSRVLTYCNAGHNPPLLVRTREIGAAVSVSQSSGRPGPTQSGLVGAGAAVRAGDFPQPKPTIVRLDFGTPPVGIFQTIPAVQQSVQLAAGELLLIFSDGIPEALNEKDEEFGEERLSQLVLQNRERTSDEMRDAILVAIRNHSGPRPPSDDMTLVVARVL